MSKNSYNPLKSTEILLEEKVVSSKNFDDVYFSRQGGLEESRYVFLQGNALYSRFSKKSRFSIFDVGFGTGLNFLATWQLWEEVRKPDAQLHYVTVEKYPLSISQMREASAQRPELQPYIEKLLACYPEAVPGIHRCAIPDSGIVLTFLWGDVNDMLPQLDAQIDAWFLDGFSPRVNPDMWSSSLFKEMSRLTVPEGSFATFTAAGEVRRGLQQVGFKVHKKPGFAYKRDMLVGHLSERQEVTPEACPWYRYPKAPSQQNKTAMIIGGGLAGTSVAYSLAQRGWQVTLIEKGDVLAAGASGNAAGIVFPFLAVEYNMPTAFYLMAYRYALAHINRLAAKGDVTWDPCGVLYFAKRERDTLRFKQMLEALGLPEEVLCYLTSEKVSDIAGVPLSQEALYFPQSGWLSVPELCQAQAIHPNIHVLYETEIASLQREGDLWHARGANGSNVASAAVTVIANASDAMRFSQAAHLPMTRVRGQVSYVPSDDNIGKLGSVLCYGGYVTPAHRGMHSIGATYEPHREHDAEDVEGHRKNIALAAEYYAPFQSKVERAEEVSGRVSYRAVSQDRVPIVGAVPDEAAFRRDYHDLHQGKHWKRYPLPRYHEGLYISVGHGSRGITSTPLTSELLASHINDEPLPLGYDMMQLLHPGRFTLRELRRVGAQEQATQELGTVA